MGIQKQLVRIGSLARLTFAWVPRTITGSQTYFTGLVPGSKLTLGTYTGAGGDAGAGLPKALTGPAIDDFNFAKLKDGWHRLSVVCDGSKSTFYVDGTSVGEGKASSTELYAIGNTVSVSDDGKVLAGRNHFGTVAEFTLYDMALSQDQFPGKFGGKG